MEAKRARGGLLSRLVQPLRRLMGTQRSAAPPPATVVAAADDRLVDDEFRLTIDTLSQDQEGRFQTRLQIISLVEFREAVGERWSRVADKVMMIAQGVIGAHIGAGNLFTRQGQDFFILVFRNCPQPEGRHRALTIAQELGTRLLGDQFIGLERPLALAAEVTLDAAINPDGSFNLAAIHDAIGEMRSILAEAAEGPLPPRRSLLPSRPSGEPAGGASGSLAAPSEIERPRGPGPEPNWQPIAVHKRHYRHQDEHGWQLAQAAVPRPAAARPVPPARPTETPPLTAGSRLSLLWRPTWLAAGEAIALYKAQIQRSDHAGAPPLEGSHAYPAQGAGAETLDRAVVAGAAGELAAASGTGAGRSSLVLPLHWASITSPQRMSLTAPLAGEGGRAGRVVVELFGVPADVPPRALADAVRAARVLGREVVLRVCFSAPRAVMAADCGVSAIGVDLADLALAERTDDGALLAELMRLREVAGHARLACYVWGVRHRRVVVGTVQGGFAMINGPALMKDLDHPGRVLPAPKARFVLPA